MERPTNEERATLRLLGLTFCPRCDRVVELMSFEDAARCYNTDIEDIIRLSDGRGLHRLYDRKANLKICGLSLFDVFERRRTRPLTATPGGEM